MRSALIALLLIGFTGACSTASPSARGKPSIVAAFYPLAFVAQRVGGSAVDVTNLTAPGAEPHDLELRPSDLVAVRGADLLLFLGGLQPAVDEAAKTLDASNKLDALSLISLRYLGDGSVDRHFWLDPTLLATVSTDIERRMEKIVPASTVLFRRNLALLDTRLGRLDLDFKSGLAHCGRHEIFTGHTAFGYMSARYGLRQISISGLNTDAEPSPKRLTEIIRLAKKLRPTIIYAEPLVASRSVDAVARAVGARVAVLNPIEGLLPSQRGAGDDYLSLMEKNLTTLEQGLSCKA